MSKTSPPMLAYYERTAALFARRIERELGFTEGRLTVTPVAAENGLVTAHFDGNPTLTIEETEQIVAHLGARKAGRA